MICRTREDKGLCFPSFYLSGQVLAVCDKAKYLGHIITDQLSDDDDLYRQRRMLYAQANMLRKKFYYCSNNVKINLFRAYCTPLYTAPLWVKYKQKSIQKLQVAYNDCMRLLLRVPRSSSASQMFVSVGVPTFSALLRNLIYRFMCRASESENYIIAVITDPIHSSTRFSSGLWHHWRTCLFIRS